MSAAYQGVPTSPFHPALILGELHTGRLQELPLVPGNLHRVKKSNFGSDATLISKQENFLPNLAVKQSLLRS